jgi:hypothetical protein
VPFEEVLFILNYFSMKIREIKYIAKENKVSVAWICKSRIIGLCRDLIFGRNIREREHSIHFLIKSYFNKYHFYFPI